MATQELQPMATTDTSAKQNKENPDDDIPLFKTAHNNPKEAVAYVKDITKLVDTFMTSISGLSDMPRLMHMNILFST